MIPTPLVLDVTCPDLAPDEQAMVNQLQWRLSEDLPFLRARESYYDGEQPMRNLGIAVPPQLEQLRTAAGWPAIVVDTLEERLDVQGFRFPSSLDADADLWDIWMANCMEQESGLAHQDALIFGRSFVMVGSPEDGGDVPLITVESPMNMAADFDAASKQVTAALQVYEFWGDQAAALYLPDQTVHLIREKGKAWRIRERDKHGLGACPVVMLANRSRTSYRYGKSEITPEIMSWTDAACRTLLGMEIAREFFGAPQRYILGASESAFQDAEGKPLNAWQTYIGWILALERDEEGNLPQVGTFTASNPQPYIDMVQEYAKRVAARTGLAPHMLGFASDNPVSAEAIRAGEAELDKKARRRSRSFTGSWRRVMQLAVMIRDGGTMPDDAHKLDVLWTPPEPPTPATDSAAVLAQVQAGSVPPASDVILERLGYSAVERARLAADRKREAGAGALSQIADALSAGSLRASLRSDAGHDLGALPAAQAAPAGAQSAGSGG